MHMVQSCPGPSVLSGRQHGSFGSLVLLSPQVKVALWFRLGGIVVDVVLSVPYDQDSSVQTPPKDPFYSAGAALALVVKTHGLNFESLHQSKLSCLCELGLKSSFCSAIYSSRVRACIHLVF